MDQENGNLSLLLLLYTGLHGLFRFFQEALERKRNCFYCGRQYGGFCFYRLRPVFPGAAGFGGCHSGLLEKLERYLSE